jgi:hypothetical protein
VTRFVILASPPVAPACCLACARGQDPKGFVDLGVMVELHGYLYLCVTCLTEIAARAGLYAPDTATLHRLEDKVTDLQRTVASEQHLRVTLEQVVSDEMLGMIERITMERIRQEVGNGAKADDEPGVGPGDRPAGGGDGGGGRGGARRARSRPAGSGAALRPGHGDPGGRPVPAAEPAAGPHADGRAGPAGDLAGAPAGP